MPHVTSITSDFFFRFCIEVIACYFLCDKIFIVCPFNVFPIVDRSGKIIFNLSGYFFFTTKIGQGQEF